MTPRIAYSSVWTPRPRPSLQRVQRAWLPLPGALTAGLRTLGDVDLTVRRETALTLSRPWALRLGLDDGARVWWREILMMIDGVPCVQACSFTPWRASQGVWRAMRGLGTHPLADILYCDPRIARSAFRFGRLRAERDGDPWVGAAAGASIEARYSVFYRQGAPLLVAEYFLPDFWAVARRRHRAYR